MTVCFQTGEEDVKEPEAEKKGWRGQSVSPGPTQFSSDVGPAPVKQHRDGQEGEDGEESDRKGQWAGRHHEVLPFHVPVDGRHWPGHADSQEDVDGVASGHIPDRGVCVGVLDGWDLTGKRVCRWKWGEKSFVILLWSDDFKCSWGRKIFLSEVVSFMCMEDC